MNRKEKITKISEMFYELLKFYDNDTSDEELDTLYRTFKITLETEKELRGANDDNN